MEFTIKKRTRLCVVAHCARLGEQVVTERGAMMGMSPDLKLETNMKGGLWERQSARLAESPSSSIRIQRQAMVSAWTLRRLHREICDISR